MVEVAPVAMVVVEADRIAYANPAARALFGGGADAAVAGAPVGRFLDRVELRTVIGGLRAPGKAVAVGLRRTDDTVAPVRLHTVATTWQGRPAVLATISPFEACPVRCDDAASRLADLETLLSNVPGLIYQRRVSPTGEISIPFVAGRVFETHGLTAEEVKANPGLLMEVVHPDDRPDVEERLNEAIETATPLDHRFRLIGGGTVRWVHATTTPRREPDGSIIWDGLLRDITEAKQQEQAIELRERALIASPGGIIITDHTARDEPIIIFVNPAFERITGYTANEAIMRNPGFLAAADRDQPGVADVQEAVAKGVPTSVVVRSYKANGELFMNRLHLAPIHDREGRLTHYVGVIHDVTDEVELRERLRIAIDTMPDGLAIFDREGRLVLFNAAYRYGMHAHVSDLVEPGVSPETLARVAFVRGCYTAATEEELDEWLVSIRENLKEPRDEERRWPNGKWIHSRSRRLPNGGTLCVFSDISKLKEAELLEGQVRQKQKMEALGTLAGGTAHEFNNMLVPIKTLAELARMEIDRANPAQELLDKIVASADRASTLIRKVLDFTRSEDIAELRPTRLDVVLRETIQLLRRTLPATVSIREKIKARDAVVLADPGQLEQVLTNLCGNSVHAIAGKVGELVIRLDEVSLDDGTDLSVTGLPAGRYYRITVRDTGHGMDGATVGRIFDPFFTTKPAGEGTGLGLAVSHGIVKAHDGAIAVESKIDVGTTFRIYLPPVDRVSVDAAAHEAAPQPTLPRAVGTADRA